uniref:Uncharacterized protein n=1 Tax=Oryza barthii TaxID=65489 RepID=A0A0D3F6M3_9ORYZ
MDEMGSPRRGKANGERLWPAGLRGMRSTEKRSSVHGLVDGGDAHTWWPWYGWAAEEEWHGKASTLWTAATAAQTTATIVAASCSRSTPPASRSVPDRVRLRAVGRSWRAVANLAVDNLGGVCSLLFVLCV